MLACFNLGHKAVCSFGRPVAVFLPRGNLFISLKGKVPYTWHLSGVGNPH